MEKEKDKTGGDGGAGERLDELENLITAVRSGQTDAIVGQKNVYLLRLKEAEDKLIKQLDAYLDLYDFAPVGYFTLTPDCRIFEVNLTGSNMLKIEKQTLIGSAFDKYLSETEVDKFHVCLKNAETSTVLLECEFELKNNDGVVFPVSARIGWTPETGHERKCRLAVMDITGQKGAEAALKASEQRYRELADSLSEGIYEADTTATLTYMNVRAKALLGITEEDLKQGMSLFDIFCPEYLDKAKARVARVLQGEDLGTSDYEMRKRDGTSFPSLIHSLAIKHEKVEGLRGIIVDITEQKKIEDALKANERRFHEMADSLSEGVFEANTNGIFTYANRRALGMVGVGKEEITNQHSIFEFISPEQVPHARQRFERIMLGEDIGSKEYTIVARKGNRIQAIIHSLAMPDKEGIRGVIIDISEQKKKEADLRASEQRYRELADSLSEGIFETDESGKVTYMNRKALAMGGLTKEDIRKGINGFDFIAEESSAKARENLQRTLRGEDVGQQEYVLKNKNGTTYPALVHSLLVKGHGLRAVLIDISERKKADEERKKYSQRLEEANAQMQQFVYAVSHDLKEPLRMVASFSQALKKHLPGELNQKAVEDINYIVGGAARMQGLLDDLLVYSRISTQAQPFRKVDMEVVFRDVMDNLKISIEENHAVVTHDPLPEVKADPSQMSQVLQNLISNAIKFHRKGERPVVHVSCKKDGEWMFAVKDNGIGIPQELFGRLFKFFSRLNPQEEYPGTGMGLAIIKRIVQRHGGRIWVESQPGKGSTFYFTLALNPNQGSLSEIDSS